MYTSGRTVKSSKAVKSPIAIATADGRRLARKHLPHYADPQISSTRVAGTDGVVRIQTAVVFREMDRSLTAKLAAAVQELPGYHSMCWNLVSVSWLREI